MYPEYPRYPGQYPAAPCPADWPAHPPHPMPSAGEPRLEDIVYPGDEQPYEGPATSALPPPPDAGADNSPPESHPQPTPAEQPAQHDTGQAQRAAEHSGPISVQQSSVSPENTAAASENDRSSTTDPLEAERQQKHIDALVRNNITVSNIVGVLRALKIDPETLTLGEDTQAQALLETVHLRQLAGITVEHLAEHLDVPIDEVPAIAERTIRAMLNERPELMRVLKNKQEHSGLQGTTRPHQDRLTRIHTQLAQKGRYFSDFRPEQPLIDAETDALLANPHLTERDIAIRTGMTILAVVRYRKELISTVDFNIRIAEIPLWKRLQGQVQERLDASGKSIGQVAEESGISPKKWEKVLYDQEPDHAMAVDNMLKMLKAIGYEPLAAKDLAHRYHRAAVSEFKQSLLARQAQRVERLQSSSARAEAARNELITQMITAKITVGNVVSAMQVAGIRHQDLELGDDLQAIGMLKFLAKNRGVFRGVELNDETLSARLNVDQNELPAIAERTIRAVLQGHPELLQIINRVRPRGSDSPTSPYQGRLVDLRSRLLEYMKVLAAYAPPQQGVRPHAQRLLANPALNDRDVAIQTDLGTRQVIRLRGQLVKAIEAKLKADDIPLPQYGHTERVTPHPLQVPVGRALSEALQTSGLRRGQVAEMAGITDNALHNLLRGKQELRPDALQRVGRALTMPPQMVNRLVRQHQAAIQAEQGHPLSQASFDTLPARIYHSKINLADHLSQAQLNQYKLLTDPSIPPEELQQRLRLDTTGLQIVREQLLKKLNLHIRSRGH